MEGERAYLMFMNFLKQQKELLSSLKRVDAVLSTWSAMMPLLLPLIPIADTRHTPPRQSDERREQLHPSDGGRSRPRLLDFFFFLFFLSLASPAYS